MNANMDSLAQAWAKNSMVFFASITVDPERDSVKALNSYAKKFTASPKWLFLTGDTSTIYSLARQGFLVNALKVNKDDFIYSDKLILIDQHKRIRGYYSGASLTDVIRLNDEIKVLISEELLEKDVPLY
jgi:protein SCO1/2